MLLVVPVEVASTDQSEDVECWDIDWTMKAVGSPVEWMVVRVRRRLG